MTAPVIEFAFMNDCHQTDDAGKWDDDDDGGRHVTFVLYFLACSDETWPDM